VQEGCGVFLDRTAPVPRATDRPDRRDGTILRHPDSRDTRVHLNREEDPDQTCVHQLGPQDFHREGIQHLSMQLPELQTWYQMHLQRAQDRVRNILEQARKPFVSSSIPMSNRPKRFLTAIIVALVCATVGAVVATGMSAANSITVQKLDMEIYALKQHINDIHQVINQQRTLLQDVLTIVEDTVVTTNLHSELIAKSTELHQSHDLFKRELLFLHDPILFHTLAFLDEVQTGMIELAGGRIPLYFVSKDIVHAMLANVDGETIEPMQLNLAFEMGSAIPLLIDPE
ncbi:Hypothetical predicted protein, partial [Pelobates cultripes]